MNPPLKQQAEVSAAGGGQVSFEISQIPPPDWDAFVSRHTSCIFFSSKWEKTLSESYGTKPFYGYLRENGIIRTGVSGSVFHFLFYKVFFSQVPYGGILGDESRAGELAAFLEKELSRRGVHQIRITRYAPLAFPDLKSYRLQPAFQHCLDLRGKSEESLWEGYRKNNRRDINKAVRAGIRIREASGEKDLKAYDHLYRQTMKRNRSLRFYPWKLYAVIAQDWIARGKAVMLLAEHEGRAVAGNLLIFSDDTAHLFGSVSSDDALKFCPNDLLIHEAILRTLRAGRGYFDFMTSRFEDTALTRFKEKWGAQSFPFSIFEKDLAPLPAFLWKQIWKISNSPLGAKLISTAEALKTLWGSR